MGRFKTTLEIRKCLHELSHIFPRSGIDGLPRVEIADEARQEALGSSHNDKREVHDVVPDTVCEMAYFVA